MCHPKTCPFADRCVPRVPPGADPRGVRLCVCDHDHDRLTDLIEDGVDQHAASLLLWAPHVLAEKEAS